ncbi:MAG: hypothetical protein CM1200mP25_3400 [Acidobacteriota bacterium]|nr:MAG: hypothetical protein CM1200mP25_3400 [Acidobacteriota bacterium]
MAGGVRIEREQGGPTLQTLTVNGRMPVRLLRDASVWGIGCLELRVLVSKRTVFLDWL